MRFKRFRGSLDPILSILAIFLGWSMVPFLSVVSSNGIGSFDKVLMLYTKRIMANKSITMEEPKGVILTNAAFTAEMYAVEYLFSETDKSANSDDVYFSFLPVAHIFDQIVETYFLSKCTSIGFWQGDVRYLIEDLQELKPTMCCGVPRFYDQIYNGIVDKISSSGSFRKGLFDCAYNYKLQNLNLEKGLRQDEAAPLFDNFFFFSKIKQSFGGRVRIMLSGGAPLPRHVEEFLGVTCCCVVLQGYGCFNPIANAYSTIGTVGIPTTSIHVRLESVPEMEYDALSSTSREELCLRGNTLFSGYHKRQDLTEEVLIDGWFHTGDIGEWQPDGSMKIIDRKKNIFKLSQGECVAVENLESIYSRCNLITPLLDFHGMSTTGNLFLAGLSLMSLHLVSLAPLICKDEVEPVFKSLRHCSVQLEDGYGFLVYDFPGDAEKAYKDKIICVESINEKMRDCSPVGRDSLQDKSNYKLQVR